METSIFTCLNLLDEEGGLTIIAFRGRYGDVCAQWWKQPSLLSTVL